MNQDCNEVFERTRAEAEDYIEQSVESIGNAKNKLYDLMTMWPKDTPINLTIKKFIEDEETGLDKKIAELKYISSEITALWHMPGSGEPVA